MRWTQKEGRRPIRPENQSHLPTRRSPKHAHGAPRLEMLAQAGDGRALLAEDVVCLVVSDQGRDDGLELRIVECFLGVEGEFFEDAFALGGVAGVGSDAMDMGWVRGICRKSRIG